MPVLLLQNIVDALKGSNVVGVRKMGNTVPRARLKPTSLAFRASVSQLHHVGFPDVTTIPHAYLSILTSEVSADHYTRPPGSKSFNAYNYIYT